MSIRRCGMDDMARNLTPRPPLLGGEGEAQTPPRRGEGSQNAAPAQSLSPGRAGGLRGGTPLGAASAASPANPATISPASPAHVVILGGGIAGLSAAWRLQRTGERDGLPITYTLVEQSDRWGGKIRSERVERDGDQAAWVLEAGPDGLLTRKPWALALARALRLENRFLFVASERARTFVLRRGRPLPLPAGLQLLAPTAWAPFLRSPLFSPWGKLRMALEPLLPRRAASGESGEADESLAAFVRRRLGSEALERVAEPLMAGVFNAEAERQSIQATFPQFPALEREHGSVIRGLRAARRKQPQTASPQPPAFLSFDTGNQVLVDALVAQLTGELRLHTTARAITCNDDGRYMVHLDDSAILAADAVILATPASVSVSLTRELAPEAAALLAGIRYAGIGEIYLAYRRDAGRRCGHSGDARQRIRVPDARTGARGRRAASGHPLCGHRRDLPGVSARRCSASAGGRGRGDSRQRGPPD